MNTSNYITDVKELHYNNPNIIDNKILNMSETDDENSLIKSDIYILKNLKNKLSDRVKIAKKNQEKFLFIARKSYHYFYRWYYLYSVSILMLSSLITFIEALKLIIGNIEGINKDSLNYIDTIISIVSLLTGIVITILSGIIRFKDYQNKLEFLSNRIMLLLSYNFKLGIYENEIIYNLIEDNNIDVSENMKLSYYNIKTISDKIIKLDEEIQKNDILKYITEEKEIAYSIENHKCLLESKKKEHEFLVDETQIEIKEFGVEKTLDYEKTRIQTEHISDKRNLKINLEALMKETNHYDKINENKNIGIIKKMLSLFKKT